jgi:probable rRNA maturation factor
MSFFIYCEEYEEISKPSIEALQGAMEGFVEADVDLAIELIFVDEEEIRRLNNETRNIDKVTDVLSYPSLEDIKGQPLSEEDYPFEIDEGGNLLIGSIAICCQRAKEQAEEYGHSYERELHYLIVHGIMHCLGYDHIEDEDRAEMREKEEYILGKLGITRA